MKSVIIAEKPSQARNIRSAIGTRYGQILSARGHIIELEEPEDVNPQWKTWGFDVLRPEGSGFYKFKPNRADGKGKILDEIESALKNADRLIIATDCDREGQTIGENIARFFRFKGEIWRVMFTSEDEKTIQDAFANMRPNADYLPLYSAGYARAQADQIANLSATRAATLALKPQWMKGALGVGRVKTPTMALVCRRELEIVNHVERDFFTNWIDVKSDDGKEARLFYKPKPEDRIFDPEIAKAIDAAARAYRGPISVKQERKKAKPPRLMDLPLLQKRAAAFSWSAQKTLDIAQALYETHKVISYPRAETKYLPEAMVPFMEKLLSDLRKIDIFKNISDFNAIIRKGKQGFFSDAGLDGASHHAIIVNPNMAHRLNEILPKLSADERKLFDLVARSIMAALAPDHVYDRTEIGVSVSALGNQRQFRVVGRVSVFAGWKEIFNDDADRDEGKDDEDAGQLPPFKDGEPVVTVGSGIEKATTTPPPRYTEGSLIEAMSTVYKLLPEGSPERARLQEAKGIGTPATRAGVIEGLKRQELLAVGKKSQIFPTELAMAVYEIFADAAPFIIDPVATAELEFQLDEIMAKRSDPRKVVDAIVANTRTFVDLMRQRRESGEGLGVNLKRKPSPNMVKAAEARAAASGITLTREQKGDYAYLSNLLGPMPERREDGTYPPSERQLAYAEKLSRSLGLKLDEETRSDRDRLNKWLDKAAKTKERSPSTPGQMTLIKRMVEEDGIEPPKGYPDQVTFDTAKRFLDKNIGKKAGARGPAKQSRTGPQKSCPQKQTRGRQNRRPSPSSGNKNVKFDPSWFAPIDPPNR